MGGGAREGLGLAPPLSPCANNTTPSFPRRPKTSTLGPSLASSPTPWVHASPASRGFLPGSGITMEMLPAQSALTCAQMHPGVKAAFTGDMVAFPYLLPPSTPPPNFQCNFTLGGRGQTPETPASWPSWHVQGAWRGSGLGTHRDRPSTSFTEKGGPNRGVESGVGVRWVSCTLGSLKGGGGEWNREGGE